MRSTGRLTYTGDTFGKSFQRFDTNGRLVEHKQLAPYASAGAEIYQYDITWRYDGERLAETRWRQKDVPFHTIYSYDDAGRRIEARSYRQDTLISTITYRYTLRGAGR